MTPAALGGRRGAPAPAPALAFSPEDAGPIHFVGLGGIGMSGIAAVLLGLGFEVQGSDRADSPALRRLEALGARVSVGHGADRLGAARVVVASSAVPDGNPELVEARRRLLPVAHRADMLAELMRMRRAVAVAGTHGKTTVTSLTAHVLQSEGLDPTVVAGGVVRAWESSARLGRGEWMVVEADESDGSLARLPATVAVLTGCDPEHMEFWGTEERLRAAFADFVRRVPFYGFSALCVDHPAVRAIAEGTRDRRVVRFGFSEDAEVRAENLETGADGARFDLVVAPPPGAPGAPLRLPGASLPLPGRHNVRNALAAVAAARGLGIEPEAALRALAGFGGVRRRFERVGEALGAAFVDDYGHHPVEIRATLETARAVAPGRVLAVVQPHRWSRLAALFDEFAACFDDAAHVLVAPVYAAGESPVEGVGSARLAGALAARGRARAEAVESEGALAGRLAALLRPGDMVVFLGAGDITRWARAAPGAVRRLAAGGEAA